MKNNLKLWHLKSVFTCGDVCDSDYEDEGKYQQVVERMDDDLPQEYCHIRNSER